jgi:hypothetical protein
MPDIGPWSDYAPAAGAAASTAGAAAATGAAAGPWNDYAPAPAQGGADEVPGNIGHDSSNLNAFGKLIGRTGIRMVGAPLADLPSLGYRLATGQGLAGWTPPTERLINAAGLQMDPNAGTLMRAADVVAPFINPFGLGEAVAEAPALGAGLAGRLASTAATRVGGAAASAIGSQLGAEAARQLDLGDTGQVIGSMLGGMAPQGLEYGAGRWLHSQAAPGGVSGPSAQEAMDAAQRLGIQPTVGMVGNPVLRFIEKTIGNVPFLGAGTSRARTAVEEGAVNTLNQAGADISSRPTTAPTVETPADPGRVGQRLVQDAQNRMDLLSGEQDALENHINATSGTGNREVQLTPLLQQIDAMMADPNLHPNDRAALQAHRNELVEASLQIPANQAVPGTPGQTLTGQALDAYVNDPANRASLPVGFWYHYTTHPNPSLTLPGTPGVAANPATITYSALKRIRNGVGRELQNIPGVSAYARRPLYDAMTGPMQDAANVSGVGHDFAVANARYSDAMHAGLPELIDRGDANAYNTVVKGATDSPDILANLQTAVGRTPLADALGGYISNLGNKASNFDLYNFGKQLGQRGGALSEEAQNFIRNQDPSVMQRLEDVGTLGRAYQMRPSNEGLGRTLTHSAIALELLKHFGTLPMAPVAYLAGRAFQSPQMIRTIAQGPRPISVPLAVSRMAQSPYQQPNPFQ